jgi:molybdenum cofactor biosynthesis enzyme MoaA
MKTQSKTGIDTIRLVVSWECNLSCWYCCNRIPSVQEKFVHHPIETIDFHKYATICLSGGEPLLAPDILKSILLRIPKGKRVVLYTNGTLLTPTTATWLAEMGVQYINVGLHLPHSYDLIITSCLDAVRNTPIKIRFQAQDIYREILTNKYPNINLHFWKMNDCEMDNEDWVALCKPSFN